MQLMHQINIYKKNNVYISINYIYNIVKKQRNTKCKKQYFATSVEKKFLKMLKYVRIVVADKNNTLCNTWLITLLLCFFLGSFGAHRFYLKKNASAITMLILTLTIFGAFITSIWCIIDLIIIICGNFTDANNNKIKPL